MGSERDRPGGAARIGLTDDVELVRTLFREYGDSLGIDLSFQGFDEELAALPAGYDRVLVVWVGGEAAGCVGVRPSEDGACEMKRLYVRSSARSSGTGRLLVETLIARARDLGHGVMRLDTLPTMDAARAIYLSLGFRPIERYNDNPIPGVLFFELRLGAPRQ